MRLPPPEIELVPQPADLEPPPQTAPGWEGRAHGPRRYIRVVSWMLVALCAANLALFGLDGLDLPFALVAALTITCLLYRRFEGTLRGVFWVLVGLSVPCWLFAAFLAYHLVLGTWTLWKPRPPLPERVMLRAELPALRHYVQVQRRFPSNRASFYEPSVELAIDNLVAAHARMSENTRGADGLAEPNLPQDVADAAPALDEFLNLRAQAPAATGRAVLVDAMGYKPSYLWRRKTCQAELLRIHYLHATGREEEAAEAYIRLLRGVEMGFEPGNTLVWTMIEAAVCFATLEYAAEHLPDLATGREAEVLAILQRIRPRVRECLRQSMLCDRMYVGQVLRNEMQPSKRTWKSPGLPTDAAELQAWATYWLRLPMDRRMVHWPFLDIEDALYRFEHYQEKMLQTLDIPLAADAARTFDSDEIWFLEECSSNPYFGLNPTGRQFLLTGAAGVNRADTRLRILESLLAAHEYALDFRSQPYGTEPASPPLDPMTGAPFLTTYLDFGSQDQLILGGGDFAVGSPVYRPNTNQLDNLHLTGKAVYAIHAVRQNPTPE